MGLAGTVGTAGTKVGGQTFCREAASATGASIEMDEGMNGTIVKTVRRSLNRAHRAVAFCFLVLVASVGVAFPHQGATGIVKERMDAMKSVAAATKALARLSWSDIPKARQSAAGHARTISAHADEMLALFPAGSAQHPSEAAATIWTRPDAFARLAKAMGTAADDILRASKTATSNADLAPPFKAMSATCASCHSAFRIKK
ncbi:MAG: cytochrome c [Pseudomonadota bacterium]